MAAQKMVETTERRRYGQVGKMAAKEEEVTCRGGEGAEEAH